MAVLRYLLVFAILAFGGWYIRAHFAEIAETARFTPANVCALVFLNLLTILVESARLRLQIRKLGTDLGQRMSWHMMTLMQAVNHVVLKAGTFSGGWFLSRRYGISFASYFAFLVTYVFVMALASGVFGFLLSILFVLFGKTVPPIIPLFFLAVIFASAGIIAIARLRPPFLHVFPEKIVRVFDSMRYIYSDFPLLLLLMGVETLYYALCALRFMVALTMFSGRVNLLDGVVVVTIGNFLRVASIVPGGLGIAEIASAWTAGALGGNPGLAGLAAGIDRAVYVALVMVFGSIGFMAVSGERSFFHAGKPETNASDANGG